MRQVYLDNNATTALCEEVKACIRESMEYYGNPSSHHETGRAARKEIEQARRTIARFINAEPDEVFFTSGGSESNNVVLKGMGCKSHGCRPFGAHKGTHIITSAIEHPSVLETCKCLVSEGSKITYLPVDQYGMVSPDELRKAFTDETILVSIMYANNEVGTIQPLRELAAITHERGAFFHTDAVQASAKIPIDVKELDADFLSLSGHKMYAPKGVGILFMRKGMRVCPLISGGHQEHGLRAGTENTMGILAMGKAAEVAMKELSRDMERLYGMRNRLQAGILERIDHVQVNGHPEKRVPNTLNVSIDYIEGEAILYMLDGAGIAVSTGSACSSGSLEPSHVLMAMGLPVERAHGSIRLSLGRMTTEEDIDYTLEHLPKVVERLRKMSPLSACVSEGKAD